MLNKKLPNKAPLRRICDVLEQLKRERDAERKKLSSKEDRYNVDKKYFTRYDELLDHIENTPRWL